MVSKWFFVRLGFDVAVWEVDVDLGRVGSREEGDHDDPQKGAGSKTERENKPDYLGFRD